MKIKNVILSMIFILMFEPLSFFYVHAQEKQVIKKKIISSSRKPVRLVRMFGKGQFSLINNIYVSSKNIIYISDASDCSVKAFNMRDEFLFSFGGKRPFLSSGQTFTHEKEREFESKLLSIIELSSDKDSNVYVADYNQDIINVYNSNGKYLFNIKLETKMQKKLNNRGVSGMAINSAGDIYIADSANGRIEVRDINRKFKYQIDKFKNKEGKEFELVSPTHPGINSHDELYVIEPLINRVHHFDAEGNYLGGFMGGYLYAPAGLAIDKYDNVYILDLDFDAVQVFDRQGKFLYALCDENGEELYIPYPTGLAVDNSGFIYIGCNDGGWGVKVFVNLE